MSLGVREHSQVMAIFNFHLFLIIGWFDKNFKYGIKKPKKFTPKPIIEQFWSEFSFKKLQHGHARPAVHGRSLL